VNEILHETGVPPERLHLEVSETALAFDAELARQVIGPLADQGIFIAMDHFGMDLTDVAQFCTTIVSEIKMDRTFLANLPGNERDRAIVRSVIGLGHNLGCLVTAQGVESRDVADALEEAGCDEAQGYLWLHPGPWTEVARVFDTTTGTTSTTDLTSQSTGGSQRAPR
jgi:EAL domain-containing protein (putative c-di-GMP-specific phosphodiesterase class I)